VNEKSINGSPGAGTAYEIAEDYTGELQSILK